jgi:hypothetical protein
VPASTGSRLLFQACNMEPGERCSSRDAERAYTDAFQRGFADKRLAIRGGIVYPAVRTRIQVSLPAPAGVGWRVGRVTGHGSRVT